MNALATGVLCTNEAQKDLNQFSFVTVGNIFILGQQDYSNMTSVGKCFLLIMWKISDFEFTLFRR